MESRNDLQDVPGEGLPAGAHHYRAFVGPPAKYDLVTSMQFNLLTALGLKEEHSLLDIGCGSLRAGRLFIPYLLPGRYFGIEPEAWLIEEGIKIELGRTIVDLKKPVFSNDSDFTLSVFDRKFDFIIAQSVFSHTAPAQMTRCLGEARKVMTSTSIFAATFVKGETNHEGDEWVYPGCVEYTLEFMKDLAGQHGLACIPLEWYHPNGQTWTVITDPANVENLPQLNNPARMLHLESQLEILEKKLSKIRKDPLVNLAMKIRNLLRRIRGKKEKFV